MFSSFFGGSDKEKENKDATKGTEPASGELLGSLFSTVKDLGKKLKNGVEKATDRAFGDFNREQQSFVRKKHLADQRIVHPPWVGYENEEELKEKIIALSNDKRNFLRDPPSGTKQPSFDLEAIMPVALATLDEDPRLVEMRFTCVPKLICEEKFWANYFYRVSLIKQAQSLHSLHGESRAEGRLDTQEHTAESAGNATSESSSPAPSSTITIASPLDATPQVPEGHISTQDASHHEEELVNTSDFEEVEEPVALEEDVRLEELGGAEQSTPRKDPSEPSATSTPLVLDMSDVKEEWEKDLQQELSAFDVDPELAAELEGVDVDGDNTANLEDEISQLLEEEEAQ